MTTNELLRRYVTDRSETAFAELVSQHLDLVYSAALRQVNGDAAAAQDVAQAVFTDLARKAPSLLWHASITGWLYTSTRYLAANHRRTEQRRRTHEQEAHAMNQLLQSAQPDPAWLELRPLLDDAMHELSPADREAVLLRYFERLPLAQVGVRLGLNENAARKRVERALEKLHAILAKRGVTSTVTALAALVAERAVASAPTGLGGQISVGAVASAASGSVFGWAMLKLAAYLTPKTLMTASAALLLIGVAIAPKLLPSGILPTVAISAAFSQAKPNISGRPAGVAGASNSSTALPAVNDNQLIFRMVADDTGKPVAGASVECLIREIGPNTPWVRETLTANGQGICAIPIVRETLSVLEVRSRVDAYADRSFSWAPNRGEKVPGQYTARLPRSEPIGGQVVNEDGQPVAGAEMMVQASGGTQNNDSPGPPYISARAAEKAITDADGRWRLDRFSAADLAEPVLQATHRDFATNPIMEFAGISDVQKQLLAGTYVYKLDRGMIVRGMVVDEKGQPVPNTKVAVHSSSRSLEATSQADGTFTLSGCPAGDSQINAEAHGFALATLNVNLTNQQTPLRLALSRANLLKVRVTDTNGLPVPNATIRLNFNPAAVGPPSGTVGTVLFQAQTDADGRIMWDSAPEGELLFGIHAEGYQWAINVPVKADGEEHQITLHGARTISGSVRDATTSSPISRFRIITGELGLFPGRTNVQWGTTVTFENGEFREVEDSAATNVQFKFEADGYATYVSRVVGPDESAVSFDVALLPAVATTVTVLGPDGQPTTNASIALEMQGASPPIRVPGGFLPNLRGNYTNVFTTDSAGQFTLPEDDTISRVLVAAPDGGAEAVPGTLATNRIIWLQPWGRVEGTFRNDGKPVAGRVLTLGTTTQEGQRRMLNVHSFNVETDADGHFAFPKVPPGLLALLQQEIASPFRGFRQLAVPPVTVHSGATTTISLELFSAALRVLWPTNVSRDANWRVAGAVSSTPASGRPETAGYFHEAGDGIWRAEDLPAGKYTVRFNVFAPAQAGSIVHPIWRAELPLVVPDAAGGMVDAGEITLQPVQ